MSGNSLYFPLDGGHWPVVAVSKKSPLAVKKSPGLEVMGQQSPGGA